VTAPADGSGKTAVFRHRHGGWGVVVDALLVSWSFAWGPVMAGGAEHSTPVAQAPVPAWVEPVPVPSVSNPVAQSVVGEGVQYLIADVQVRLGATNATYYHYALHFLNESGVRNGSSVAVSFDPSFQTPAFHALRLWRNGVPVDCLRDGMFRSLAREENLEQNLLDGRRTLLALVEDVRVGDTLEYAYTVTGENPIFNGRYVGTFALRWGVPLARAYTRIVIPDERTLRRRLSGEGVFEPVERAGNGWHEWIWEQTHVPPVQFEGDEPAWYKALPTVSLSEYASWGEVAHWAASCFSVTGQLDETQSVPFSEWRQLPSDAERVVAALSFVQNEIRYFGLELGVGSHRPNPPDLVLQRRFGDCKDKALLLCSLLARVGVAARPGLVNVWSRGHVADELPSPLAFNHVIVAAQADGGTVWVDPARSDQRGTLHQRYLPNYAVALDAASGSTGLVAVGVSRFLESTTDVHERYDLQDAGQGALLRVRTMLKGRDAEMLRAQLAGSSRDAFEKQRVNYYAQRFPAIQQKGETLIEDDAKENILCTTENYQIQDIWRPDVEEANRLAVAVSAAELAEKVAQPATVLRMAPLGVPYPLDVSQTIEVVLPEKWFLAPKQVRLKDDAVDFAFDLSITGNRVTLRYRLRTLCDSVPPGNVAKHLHLRREIANLLDYSFFRGGGHAAPLSVNWFLIGLTVQWCAVLAALWVIGYRYRPEPFALPGTAGAGEERALCGIGGWLIVSCIGLAATLIAAFCTLATDWAFFDANTWAALTVQGQPAYHPLWRPAMIVELFGTLFLIALVSLNGVLLVQRRASFPRLMILLFLSNALVVALMAVFAEQIPAIEDGLKPGEPLRSMVRAVTGVCVWVPYFLKSKRVRYTFRR
jgi:hypothetical protein